MSGGIFKVSPNGKWIYDGHGKFISVRTVSYICLTITNDDPVYMLIHLFLIGAERDVITSDYMSMDDVVKFKERIFGGEFVV